MTHTLFLGQMWKLNGTRLVNKGGLWKSYDNWTLDGPTDDQTYFIENESNKRILAIKDTDDTVISIKKIDDVQYDVFKTWNKEMVNEKNCKDFFTLIHPYSEEVLTATTGNRLIVSKGIYAQGKFKIKLLKISLDI